MKKLLRDNLFGLPENEVIRQADSSRIEQLSDAIFALAITMLLISLETPKTYEELIFFVSDFLVFIICMAAITQIWYQHHLFFLRYNLRDRRIILINTLLLALVLFYVYPLKFFVSNFARYFYYLLISNWVDVTQNSDYQTLITTTITWENTPQIMLLYSAGYLGIIASFLLFHRHALYRRVLLNMGTDEYFLTKQRMYVSGAQSTVILVSIALAFIAAVTPAKWLAVLSGWVYFLIWPAIAVARRMIRVERKKHATLDDDKSDLITASTHTTSA